MDCLGVGNTFSIITGQGIIFRRKADPTLVNFLKSICDDKGEQCEYNWETLITGGNSDHAEWLERGFKAITVIKENYKPSTLPAKVLAKLFFIPYQTQFELEHIHTMKDTLEIVHKEKLEKTVEIVQELLTRLEQRV